MPAIQPLPLSSAVLIAGNPDRAEWLLRPYLERGAMILMVGAEGTYKSFLSLHWAMTVAMQGELVIYLSAEGRGLWKRLRAWCLHHCPQKSWFDSLNGLPLLAIERPVNLSSAETILRLTTAIDQVTEARGRPALIVIDTMTRNSDGSIERSNEDALMYLNGLDQQVRARYGCSVILVHHIGHAARDRARGPFALIASTDANYLLERPDVTKPLVTVRSGRMKDCEPPAPFVMEAHIVTLDEKDEAGFPQTSLVLRATDAAPPTRRIEPKGRNQQLLLGALREHVRANASEIVSTLDLQKIAKAQNLDRRRLQEVRQGLEQAGWIAETIGGVKLLA
jgi:hypothetical protein